MADIGGVSRESCFVCFQLEQVGSNNSVDSEGRGFKLHEEGVRGNDGGV